MDTNHNFCMTNIFYREAVEKIIMAIQNLYITIQHNRIDIDITGYNHSDKELSNLPISTLINIYNVINNKFRDYVIDNNLRVK